MSALPHRLIWLALALAASCGINPQPGLPARNDDGVSGAAGSKASEPGVGTGGSISTGEGQGGTDGDGVSPDPNAGGDAAGGADSAAGGASEAGAAGQGGQATVHEGGAAGLSTGAGGG
ncbi:MAG: hypothetical protein K0R38_5555 [Polyangiaceae bacterium]|nr:hypothetical protein [Polyangiaceae bacterium]